MESWLVTAAGLLLVFAANAALTRWLVGRAERRIMGRLRSTVAQVADWREQTERNRREPETVESGERADHASVNLYVVAGDPTYGRAGDSRCDSELSAGNNSLHAEATTPGRPHRGIAPPAGGGDPGRELEPVTPTEPPFSEAYVQELYRRWCEQGEAPSSTTRLEVSPLRYAKKSRAGDLIQPVHYFEDAEQIGEVVRFSPRGEGVGLAFPHPKARRSREVLGFLFEDIDEFLRDHQRLALVEPVRIRKQGAYWEKQA